MNYKSIITALLLTICTSLVAQNRVDLSDLNLRKVYQSYGSPMINKAVTGEALVIRGVPYSRGIGLQANSKIKIKLHQDATRFSCKIGINDSEIDYHSRKVTLIPLTDGKMLFYDKHTKQYLGLGTGDRKLQKGSAVLKIIGDSKVLYQSPILYSGKPPYDVTVRTEGINILELEISSTSDGKSGDHVDLIDPIISYNHKIPQIINVNYSEVTDELPKKKQKSLTKAIKQLPEIILPIEQASTDWLINNKQYLTKVYRTQKNKGIILSNGLISRVFRILPNLATVDFINHMTNENMLRAVSPEGSLTIDNNTYSLGGLQGQEERAYLQYEWVEKMTTIPNSFQVTDFEVSNITPRFYWKRRRWSLEKGYKPRGKMLTFHLKGPKHLANVEVLLHYALYDGMPTLSKWFEIKNNTPLDINLDKFTLEELAFVEPESPVELNDLQKFRKPNIHVESDWGFHGFLEKEAESTENWVTDPKYTSQCSYQLLTPCVLKVELPMGPDVTIASENKFESFRTWLMPFDSDERERKGLFVKRMYRKIAPWTTENPIFLHCTSSDPETVKRAVDQCAEVGYEVIILSFGSGVNMEDESPENYEKFKELREYANEKGIELGGYSLLSSRWISDEVDVINPKTGKRGGMIFGSSPCLSSEWGHNYFRKIKKFYEKTGMTVFENDGSYPGNVCASTRHKYHKGLKDSQWEQRKQITNLYQWMCSEGIYMNIPDYGYLLNGSNKTGIGYREVNWSLPRERQLILGRQVMYDGLWERLPSMCWTFVPLTQYHGGGEAATLEPLNKHLDAYKAHMMQNYGSGVQACYRGPRLFDTNKTKRTVKEVIDWYKKYRDILNSDIIHLRRADGRDWDGIMHVSPSLKEKGLVMLYNPTNKKITRKIKLPLYYTGLTNSAFISEEGKPTKRYKLDRKYCTTLKVVIPAKGYKWYVIK